MAASRNVSTYLRAVRTLLATAAIALVVTGCGPTAATNVTSSSATLHAGAPTGDSGSRVYFEYGAAGGSLTKGPQRTFSSPLDSVVPISLDVSGLVKNTRYRYRLCGWPLDDLGSKARCSSYVEFTTAASSSAPPCRSFAYSDVPTQGAVSGVDVTETTTGSVQSPINELSGLAAHRTKPDVWWGHNDSGDHARIFAINGAGKVLATYGFLKQGTNDNYVQDWSHGDFEDIAAYRSCMDRVDRVVTGNIGSGSKLRELLVMTEPAQPTNQTKMAVKRISLDFSNFTCYSAKDSEGMMVDPISEDVFLFEKCGNVTNTRMFVVTGAQMRAALATSNPTTIRPAPVLAMRTGSTWRYTPRSESDLQHKLVTGAEISPNGLRIAVKTYEHTYVWERRADESVVSAMSRAGAVLKTRNSEAVAFTPDSAALVQAGEGKNATIYRYAYPAPGAGAGATAGSTAPPETTSPVPTTSEAFYATKDHAFVSTATDKPYLMNGANTRDVVTLGNAWTYSRERFATLKGAGFNSVRMPLDWDDFEPRRGAFDQTSLTTLDTAIANAKAAGLHVILDPLHLKNGDRMGGVPSWAREQGGDSVQIVQREAAPWIRVIANRYGTESAVVAVDLVNEAKVTAGLSQNTMIDMYNALITAYRAIDPDKILILESQSGDSSVANADFSRLVTKQNIVWSLHFYFAGGHESGYSSSGWVTGNQVWDGTSGYPSPNKAQLERHLTDTLTVLRANGLPLYVGEYGIGAGATNYEQWWADVASIMNKHGVSRAAWEWHSNGSMSITNSDYSMKPFVSLLL